LIGGATAAPVAAIAATSLTSSGAGASCAPAGAHRLASSGSAEVYSSHGTVYGCSERTGRRTKLGQTTSCVRADLISRVRVAGEVTAYADERCGVDTGSTTIVVMRLSDGKRFQTDPATTGRTLPESYQSVDSLVLRRDRGVAWIANAHSIIRPSSADIEGHADDRGGARLLDSGAGIDPGSLRLRGSRLTWKHGGATRSARLI
jgi:hypothetical protein